MIRGILLCVIGVGLLTILWVLSDRHATEERLTCENCNVILISIDTFGAKHSSVYDPTLNTTPFMEELAKRSIVFENAFSQAPWTLPSHTAMLTGQYPWDIGVWENTDSVPDTTLTLAEALKENGYQTAAFSGGAFVQPGFGFGQGFDEFTGSNTLYDWDDIPQLFVDAQDWLTKREDSEKPFFLFIRPFGIHDPYGVPDAPDTIHVDQIVEANLQEGGPSKEDSARFERAYRAEVTKADTALADFFETLDTLDLTKNTVIIITSDHGEEFGEHGTAGFHSVTVYRETINVPLVITLPSGVERRVSNDVEVRSIPSTILSILSRDVPPDFAAPSLTSLLLGDTVSPQPSRSRTAYERDQILPTIVGQYNRIRNKPDAKSPVIPRKGAYIGAYAKSSILWPWHAIKKIDGTVELYRVDLDPNETKNVVEQVRFLPHADKEIVETLLADIQDS